MDGLLDELHHTCRELALLIPRAAALMRGCGVQAIGIGGRHFELQPRGEVSITRLPVDPAAPPEPQRELPL